jgi:hypothetical protein
VEFADFVVDPEWVRTVLPAHERPSELTLVNWLAIGVAGTAVVRKTWYDEAEVSEALFQELVGVVPPALTFDQKTQHRTLDARSRGAEPTKCRTCAASRGRNLCPTCGGLGEMHGANGVVRCDACEGGTIRCVACDGTLESYGVRVAYHEDEPIRFAHVFVPEEVPALRRSMIAFVSGQTSIPECLGLDLNDEFTTRDAYRGRRGDHEHRGHRFAGALALARRYVQRIVKSPAVMKSRVTAVGWPFATLAHQSSSGFAIDADGNPHRV